MDMYILLALSIYVVVLTLFGCYFYKITKTSNEFALGDRSINYFVTAIGAQASDMSGWLMLAFPAAIYTIGLFEAWTAIGLVFFMFLNWQFIAPRLRTQTERMGSLTLSSLFDAYFHDTAGTLRFTSACISLVFFTCYIASGIVAMGRVFESLFAIDYHIGITVGLAIVLIYTLLGGFLAVAWSNVFQGLFLLAMIILVPLYGFFHLSNGWQQIINAAAAHHVSLSLGNSWSSIGYALLHAAGWGLGYFGQPQILIYFMGIDDVKKIAYAKYVGITWQIIALAAAVFLGLVGLAFFATPLAQPELLFIAMAQQLFHPLLVGFILCAILAAILSTMNSHILVAGSVLTTDIYARLKNFGSIPSLFVSRMCAVAVSLCALVIAWNNNSTIYNLVQYAWSGLGSTFGPLVIAVLYDFRFTKNGALCGLIVGGVTAALWPYIYPAVPALIPAFCFNLIVALIISRFKLFSSSE
jgi:sodium/proline symporter